VIGYRRQQTFQFGPIDQLFMGKAVLAKVCHPRTAILEILIVHGDQNLAMGFEAAIIAHQILDPFPQVHGRDRKRNLGAISGKLAHATGIHARGMATRMVLLDHDHAKSPQRQMQRR
jgi:hypothetical protein